MSINIYREYILRNKVVDIIKSMRYSEIKWSMEAQKVYYALIYPYQYI